MFLNDIISRASVVAALVALCTFAACDASDRPDATPASVEFLLSTVVEKTAARTPALTKSLQASSILVTIADSGGADVFANHEIQLFGFGQSYLTDPISLPPGSYSLTQFVVLDALDDALYATPIEGSNTAHLVADPLPIDFTTVTDQVTTVTAQTVSTDELVPEDFGYVSFEPEVVEIIDFLVATMVYDPGTEALVLTDADIAVSGDGGATLYNGPLAAVTNHLKVPDGHASYQITVSKDGYVDDSESFTAADLALHFADADNGPLMVVLQSLTVSAINPMQSVATRGAHDWEHFQIGADHYLALANYQDDGNFNTDSKIYRWNGTGFVDFQTVASHGGRDWAHFQIGTDHYLALANFHDHTSWDVDSKIYKWDGALFVEYQNILTHGASDWEYVQIGSDHYLMVANFRDSTGWLIDSKLYKWNGATFVEYQSIATSGAILWEHFQIGTTHYAVIANQGDGATGDVDSKLYYWDGTGFVELQSIPTSTALDWEHVQIGTDHYLAVSNYSGTIGSKLYRWDGAAFVEHQVFPLQGDQDWAHFQIGSEHYLAAANHSFPNYDLDSKIYRWDGATFVEALSVPTLGAKRWEPFRIGDTHFMGLAQEYDGTTYNLSSTIYQLTLQ